MINTELIPFFDRNFSHFLLLRFTGFVRGVMSASNLFQQPISFYRKIVSNKLFLAQ